MCHGTVYVNAPNSLQLKQEASCQLCLFLRSPAWDIEKVQQCSRCEKLSFTIPKLLPADTMSQSLPQSSNCQHTLNLR